ncbi:MAG: LytTR family DNA-binding domain-containing protein [Bacteroidota bacterium]
MRIAIVDDEQHARSKIRRALENRYADRIDWIAEKDSITNALDFFSKETVDLLFLDIQMGDGTAFDLLNQLPEMDCGIIFITAYDNFALKAFEFYAFSYLVKPLEEQKFYEVVDHYLAQNHNGSKRTKMLTEAYQSRQLKQLVISHLDGFEVIQLQDILYLKSDSNYTELHLSDKRQVVCSKTLKEYEKLLLSEGFFRTHRSYLVNLNKVKAYSKKDGGEVAMINGIHLPISRRRLAEFRNHFLG